MESHHHQPYQQGKGMLWSDAPLRQLRGSCSPEAFTSPAASSQSSPRSRSVVLVDPLPPTTAPLWRNAPNHHLPHLSGTASTAATGTQPHPQLQSKRSTPPRTISPAASFQQSLRYYPAPPTSKGTAKLGQSHSAHRQQQQQQFSIHQRITVDGHTKQLEPGSRKMPQSKTVPALSAVADNDQSRCHVTNLEGESSTPFFLDYLDSQSAMVGADPMLAQPIGAFNHRQFMEMFRSEPSEQLIAREGNAAAAGKAGVDDSGSLPYAVNTEGQQQFLLRRSEQNRFHPGSTARSSAFDSLASNTSDQRHSYSRPTPVDQVRQQQRLMRRRSAPKIASGGYSKENVVFRKALSKTMDNKNSQSSSNISQRLQIAAERRTQIEEARRERVQRQIEQSPRPMTATANMQSQGLSQNPSVAFGSTRPRNIDLTRPLVTPIPSARPKSEIFPSTFYAGAGGGGGSTVVDSPSFSSPSASYHVFAKDDANYQTATRSPRTPMQQSTPSLMSQSMIVPSTSSSNNNHNNYRAVRRHDPELVPAMQKYIFREYAMPTSSGTPSLRKENSMISSMMSTKSFQQGASASASSPFYRTPFGGPQNRPKKSYSMNRLDQLAQPRRRVELKVPTSASFVRPKVEPLTSGSKKPVSATEGTSETRVKPVPPPKTLFKSLKPQTVESSTSSPAAAPAVPSRSSSSRPATTPKPRPLSQIELSSAQSTAASEEAASTEGEKEFEGSDVDRLAEYKRALAEKRAMFRKQQEEQQLQQQQNPVRKAKIVKPEPAPVVAEAENTKNGPASFTSSSSSSSSSEASDDEADNEDEEHKQQSQKQQQKKPEPASSTAPLSVELAQVNEETKKTPESQVSATINTAVSNSSTNSNEQLVSFDGTVPSSNSQQQVTSSRHVNDMMSTSLTSDLAALAISGNNSEIVEKTALSGASMTASFDASLLSEAKDARLNQQQQSSGKTAAVLTKEQLEERSAILLQQQMAEREKRKNRVQEILKRTRKDEKKEGDASKSTSHGSNQSDSSQSENEANNGNNSDEACNSVSGQLGEEGSNGKFNGHNGESSSSSMKPTNDNHSNGHLGSNHHRDMKTFVSENEQSLPPTNGF